MRPRNQARLAGVFETLEGLFATYGQVIILGKIIVSGDAVRTSANILAHQTFFQFGFACTVAGVVFHVAWAMLFYEIFRTVNPKISLFATFVILVGCAVQAVTSLLYIAPLLVLNGGSAVSAFSTAQLQGIAMILLKLNAYAFDIYLVFFGLWCLMTGYLIYRSTFLPRLIGILMAFNGIGWMLYIVPPFAYRMFPAIAFVSAISELPLQLWLLIAGVNEERWYAIASGSIDRNASRI